MCYSLSTFIVVPLCSLCVSLSIVIQHLSDVGSNNVGSLSDATSTVTGNGSVITKSFDFRPVRHAPLQLARTDMGYKYVDHENAT
jgi:hypothetical protein